ncbi:GIY-YIG nuclease family protein [Lignipirellula cremea]|uniref:GIY-YIG nuclease superfamily protein n=1 Tax=Lignipirellula cremea TaxID=2528010 RepID=A0A518E1W8_9BACT|nr:GIY-YIG nuclease family protein [Lignipirellula cremea]QDU98086.1 GIY-YIG nuclease superfamily protein [Lignipirellula cremea]
MTIAADSSSSNPPSPDPPGDDPPASPWFVYMLRCDDDSLYTGVTTDLERRCGQHNKGSASRYTRSRLPVVLVYQEEQADRSAALKRELRIKALTRRQKESLIRPAE